MAKKVEHQKSKTELEAKVLCISFIDTALPNIILLTQVSNVWFKSNVTLNL
jgi:hypothetical protein